MSVSASAAASAIPAPSAAPSASAAVPAPARVAPKEMLKRAALFKQLDSVLRVLDCDRTDVLAYPTTQSSFPEAPKSLPYGWTPNEAFYVVLSNRSKIAGVTHRTPEAQWLFVAFRKSATRDGTPTVFCAVDSVTQSGGGGPLMRTPEDRTRFVDGGRIRTYIDQEGWKPDGEVRNPGIDVELGLDAAAAEEHAQAAEAVAKTARAAAEAAQRRFLKASGPGVLGAKK